jgi:tetratricopeptide (TPR) repeat protein
MANLSHMENNQPSLQALLRAIEFSQGQFGLILVRCNYRELRDRIMQQLRQQSPIEIQELVLPKNVKSLYTKIQEKVSDGQTKALMVSGLESAIDLNAVLTSSNYIREEFNRNFPFPLLVWVNNEVLEKFYRLMPDFTNWATTTKFTLTPDELVKLLQRKDEQLFASNLTINPEDRSELEAARQDSIESGVELAPNLEASLEFGLGLCDLANNQIDSALAHYEKSLSFYCERPGTLLLNMARCYERQAEQNQVKKIYYLTKARDELQQCLDLFNKAQRLDLVAEHIGKLGEVLRRLQDWDGLRTLAKKALELHKDVRFSRQLAQDYGFLAEVFLNKLNYQQANESAQKAISLEDINAPNRSLYQLLLANSQSKLGQVEDAVSNLKNARNESDPQSEPQLYIDILEKLRSLHFEQGEYREAFQIKQEKLRIEHQYGFRAFIGASALPCPVENKG